MDLYATLREHTVLQGKKKSTLHMSTRLINAKVNHLHILRRHGFWLFSFFFFFNHELALMFSFFFFFSLCSEEKLPSLKMVC